jgi:hypothetical protein
MVIPAALIGSIGLDDLFGKAADHFRLINRPTLVPAVLLVVLLSLNFYMLWDVLTNGISWFDAHAMQFGASKVFPALKEQLKITPNAHAVISPEWIMMGDVVARIYMGDHSDISFNSTYDYARRKLPLKDDTIFVITPAEFDFAKTNPKFSDIQVLKTIPYSSTKVGFYLIHLKYSPQADALFAAERVEKRKLIPGEVVIDGQKVQINYTRTDGTLIQDAFDNDPVSLYKTAEINPAEFDLTFPQDREFHSVFILHGTTPIELKVTFFPAAGDEQISYITQFTGNGDKGDTLDLGQAVKATRVNISVQILHADESTVVHVWGIAFK